MNYFVLILLVIFTNNIICQSGTQTSELGDAACIFEGNLEVVSEHPDFVWLEGPLWSEAGKYLLFSDVSWHNTNNVTCGMIWRYDDANGLSEFLRCSGLIGPGDTPANINDYIEAGSNGLYWGWKGEEDLLVCQHGKSRIVRFNITDVLNGEIESSKVSVVTDSYNNASLNSPNDLVIVDNVLYFTDPPFGRQLFSESDPIQNAFNTMPQSSVGIYTIMVDPGNNTVEPSRIINFEKQDPWATPNGIAITKNRDIITPITTFHGNPRVEVRLNKTSQPIKLSSQFRIKGQNSALPPLNDGITYDPDHDLVFSAGPGGVYVYDTSTWNLLGFLRIDDLNSNNVIGGGYLWITANKRLLRIRLSSTRKPCSNSSSFTPMTISPTTKAPTSLSTTTNPSSISTMVMSGFIILFFHAVGPSFDSFY